MPVDKVVYPAFTQQTFERFAKCMYHEILADYKTKLLNF